MEEKMTTDYVLNNYQKELEFLQKIGHTNSDTNISKIIEFNGLPGYLKEIYGYDFEKFTEKDLNRYLQYEPFETAYSSLINNKGDVLKSMEELKPNLFELYTRIEKEGFKDREEIIRAMYYNNTSYNDFNDAIRFLKRKEIYAEENKELKNKYNLNNEDENFEALYIKKGNVFDAVCYIDSSIVTEPIKKRLLEDGITYNIDDYTITNKTKTYEDTISYIKLDQGDSTAFRMIENLLNDKSYSTKLEYLLKANNEPYTAATMCLYPEIYNKYKGKFSPMFLHFLCIGVEGDVSKCEELINSANQTMEKLKPYVLHVDSEEVLSSILKYRENDILKIIKGLIDYEDYYNCSGLVTDKARDLFN